MDGYDDHTSYEILLNAKKGKLKAAIKWGVGTDIIDFDAFKKLEIPAANTQICLVMRLLS